MRRLVSTLGFLSLVPLASVQGVTFAATEGIAAGNGLAAGNGPDQAAAAPGPGLDEVMVTAERRTERLEDVPVSVEAFSQDRMDSQGVRSIDDVAKLTPGV